MGFKQNGVCPNWGRAHSALMDAPTPGRASAPQDLSTTGTCSTNPRGQRKLCNGENHLEKLEGEKAGKQKSPVVLLSLSFLSPHPQQHPQGSGCSQPSHIHQRSDRGKYCHPQINFMELIILAVHCSLPEEHLEASVLATTA